jgi:hypothetical protein
MDVTFFEQFPGKRERIRLAATHSCCMNLIIFGLSFAFLLTAAPKGAPALVPQTRIVLEKLIREPKELMGEPQHYIVALSFSPDSTRLAAVVGRHRYERQNLVHLVVFRLDQVDKALWQADLASWSPGEPDAFRWSENGQLLFVQFVDRVFLIDAITGATICQSHEAGVGIGYLMPGGLIGPNLYVVGNQGDVFKKDGRLWFYDLSCKLVMQGRAEARPISGDTAPTAGLLAMADEGDKIVVLQPDGHQKFSTPDGRTQMQVAFLNSGGMLCSGRLPGPDDGSLRCWKLNAPSPLLFRRYEVNKGGTAPFATSSAGSIVMIPERGFSYNPFTENERWPLKRYVIWDAESGNTIATIAPRKQWLGGYVENTPRKLGDSVVFAVSRDGGFVALASQDSVEIFKIPAPGIGQ